MKYTYLYLLFGLLVPSVLHAQLEETFYYGKKYLDVNVRSLNQYTKRIERQQQRLLNKLRRKENKLAWQLKKSDSATYVFYRRQSTSLSYDSIARLRQNKEVPALIAGKSNKAIDSLKKVQDLLQQHGSTLNTSTELTDLQSRLNYQQYINSLIDKRNLSLKSLAQRTSSNIPALKGIEQQVFYGKSRMNEWKKVADEPSRAEEMALEYLQGTKGFSFNTSSSGGNSMQNAASEADLERMGFQTKRQLNEQLQKQFGGNLEGLQQKMGEQVADFNEQLKAGSKQVKDATQQIRNGKKELSETKSTVKSLKSINKPSFKVNPMRGLPFWRRIEKGYTFNTSRAAPDGKRPAILELAGTVAFKHTPRLSYCLGMATSIGLGQDWSHIRLTYEGVGARSFVTYETIFGIAAYAGYERFFKSQSPQPTTDNQQSTFNPHNTTTYSEALLLGLSKKYKLNSKWNGAIQLLYDVWWREKGMNSPLVLRICSVK